MKFKILLAVTAILFSAACSMKVTSQDEKPVDPQKPVQTPKDTPAEQQLVLSQPGASQFNHIVVNDLSLIKDETLGFLFHVPAGTTGKMGLGSISYTGCTAAETVFQLVELKDTKIVAAVPMSVWTQHALNSGKSEAILVGIQKFKGCKSLFIDFLVDHKN